MVNHRRVVSRVLFSIATSLLLYFTISTQQVNASLTHNLELSDSLYRETIEDIEDANKSIDNLASELEQCQDSDELTENNVKRYIKWLKLKHPDVIWAMIQQESSLKSNIAKINNNIIGMKHPKERVNVSLGEKNGHAYYENWQMGLIDIALWQARYINHKKFNREQFLDYLQKNYAEDPNYKQHLKKFL